MYISMGVASPRAYIPVQRRRRTETDLATGHKLFLAILVTLLAAFLVTQVLAADVGVETSGSRVETKTEADVPSPVSAHVDLADESPEPAADPMPSPHSLPMTSPYTGESQTISDSGGMHLPE
jgi:hypothetical protein